MKLIQFLTRSRFAHAVQRWTGEPGVCLVSGMVFVVYFEGGTLPQYACGPVGRELSCYIPDGLSWKQINFGQGEGQVEIGGNEWGFYFGPTNPGELHVVLHSGEISPADATAFVHAVAVKLAGSNERFDIRLRGIKHMSHRRPC